MKCPKCGYLGFESGDSCRNCGYEFSLSAATSDPMDLPLDLGPDESRPPLDLDRVIGARDEKQVEDLPLFSPSPAPIGDRAPVPRRAELSGVANTRDDAPLITGPLKPRAPLVVRRATPEVPRARTRPTKTPAHEDMFFESDRSAPAPSAVDTRGEALAAPFRRIVAAVVDLALICALDALVLYFTLRLLGLGTAQLLALPLLPLVAFLLLLNGGYFIAFTAVGGQSIGKMAVGIKVISQEESGVPIGRATIRTLAYVVSALPLGAGFVPGVLGADRLALHDRLAHTRVVRPSST
jgi:uncharacterized RDD family membrane protein YckC